MTAKALFLLIAPGVIAVAVACSSAQAQGGPADVQLSASVAYAKAQEFFDQHIGCGALGAIRDDGNRWAIEARVGYAGDLDPHPIFVDKRTGQVTWESLDIERKEQEKLERTPMEEF